MVYSVGLWNAAQGKNRAPGANFSGQNAELTIEVSNFLSR
jgi:hypothetical protein